MNFIVDIGNSRTKTAMIEGKTIRFLKSYNSDKFIKNYRQNISQSAKIGNCIISSVRPLSKEVLKSFDRKFKSIVLSENTLLPFKNAYKTKKTLGNDRLANIAGAITIFPNKNVLAIDAGTCITYDFITSRNEYKGGAISPGIAIRFESLNQFTHALPLVKSKSKKPKLLGNTTISSIQSGVLNSISFEITAFISELKKKYPSMKVILCGGDATFLADRLKNSIFVSQNLTLIGLNAILNYNKKASNAS